MKGLACTVLVLALLAALVPVAAFAQSTEQQSPSDAPAQAPLVLPAQPELVSPPAAVANDTTITQDDYGAAIARAYDNLANAQAQLKENPTDAHLQADVAAAQAAYVALLEPTQPVTPLAAPGVMVAPPPVAPAPATMVLPAEVPGYGQFTAPPNPSDQTMPESSQGGGSLLP
jgi:hypothetical protein